MNINNIKEKLDGGRVVVRSTDEIMTSFTIHAGGMMFYGCCHHNTWEDYPAAMRGLPEIELWRGGFGATRVWQLYKRRKDQDLECHSPGMKYVLENVPWKPEKYKKALATAIDLTLKHFGII